MARSTRSHSASRFMLEQRSPAFANNVRRLLQVRAATSYNLGEKSGKIAASRLWRVGLPPIDSGDWNSRVFKRETEESDVLHTAVFLLVDWSGSMAGRKCEAAAKASQLINDAFAQVLHIPLKIVAFTSTGPFPVMGVMKNWNERVSDVSMAERFFHFSSRMSGNNDADALLWSYKDIIKRDEKRKVIIVLSDGSPADGFGDPYFALKQVVGQILKEKRVDLYGLGIMDTNVKDFYPKNVVINRESELERSLVALMGKALVNGGTG